MKRKLATENGRGGGVALPPSLGSQARLAIATVILGVLALAGAMVWALFGEYRSDRAAHLENLRSEGRSAATRLESILAEQRLELSRLVLAQSDRLQRLDPHRHAGFAAATAMALQRRFPDLLAVEVVDGAGRNLAIAGLTITDGEDPESLRQGIAPGRPAVLLNLASVPAHYVLAVPLPPSSGAGALIARMSDSALAKPLEWFEQPGHHLYLVEGKRPDHPLLAAQRPFDLTRGIPASGRIDAGGGALSPVPGTGLAVVTVADAGFGWGWMARYLATGATGMALLAGLAWLLVERILLGEKRRRENAHKAQQNLHRAEDALRESEARANLILDTVPEGMLVVDGEGRIVRHNLECPRMFGYGHDEMLGLPVEALVPAATACRHRELRQSFQVQGSPRKMGSGRHFLAVRRDGSEFPVEISLGPVTIAGKPHVIVMISDISGRIAAELELKRFRQVMDTSGDLLVFVDLQLRYGICNPAYSAQFGMSPAELHGRPVAEILPGPLFAEVEPILRRALAGETVAHVTTHSDNAGKLRIYEAEFRPFRTASGIEGVVTSMHDVTQRVESEQALRESKLKVRAMLDTPLINMGLLDLAGHIQQLNAKALQAAGTSLAELIGRPFWEGPWYRHDAQVRLRVRLAVEAAMLGQTSRFEATSYLSSGEVRHENFIVQPIRDKAGHIVWIAVQSIDITDAVAARRNLERHQETLEAMVAERTAELALSEDKFRGLVEQSMVGIYIIADGKFAYVNPGHARMLGYDSAEDIVGIDFLDCVAPASREEVLGRVTDRLTGRAPVSHYTFTALRKDGSEFQIEVQGRGIEYQGRPAVIGIATDVTERLRLDQAREAALAEARRLADARSEFLANMSHEIRTPLHAVLGLAQIGLRDSRGQQEGPIFQRILDSGQTLLAVVDDILDFSKIEAGKLTLEDTPFDLGAVVDQAVRMIAPRAYEKGLELVVEESPALPRQFRGDSTRLTQILLNLLSNAVKFTAAGSVRLTVTPAEDGLALRVCDTGIGIAPEHIERLFQAFEQADGSTTRHFGGTGLGLSIVDRLVKLMGGSVSVDSVLAQGSAFEVRLPLQAIAAPPPPSFSGRVGLMGLPEAGPLAAALAERGIAATVLAPEDVLAAPPALLLLDAGLAADPHTLPPLVAALGQAGSQAFLVTTPGRQQLAGTAGELLPVLERPLHPRSVLAAPHQRIAPPSGRTSGQRLAGLNILAAEDNEINRLVLEEMLAAEGARLSCLENGQKALERILAEGPEAFHAVITDIQMPELDGYGLARRLREIAPDLPVIGLTANALPDEHSRCLAAGMVEQITKPVEIETLVAILGRLAAWPGQSSGPAPAAAATSCPPAESFGIDWKRLDARFPGREEFVTRLAARFEAAHARTPETLRHLAANGDFSALRFQAHSLKGMFGNLVAMAAMDQASRTEQLARAEDPAALEEAGKLAEALEAVLAAARTRTAATLT